MTDLAQLLPTRLLAVAYAAAPQVLDDLARTLGFAHWTALTWKAQFHVEDSGGGFRMLVAPLIADSLYLLLTDGEAELPTGERDFALVVCDGAPEHEVLGLEFAGSELTRQCGPHLLVN